MCLFRLPVNAAFGSINIKASLFVCLFHSLIFMQDDQWQLDTILAHVWYTRTFVC